MKPIRSSSAEIQGGILRFFPVPLSLVVRVCIAFVKLPTRYLKGVSRRWCWSAIDARVEVRRLLSKLDAELHGHVAVILLTLVVWGVRARAALSLMSAGLGAFATALTRPVELWHVVSTEIRFAVAMISVGRHLRVCARAGLTIALIAATMLAGVPTNSLAAVVTFDSDGNGANGITEAGGTYTWNSGQATFYNGTIDVATTSADIARLLTTTTSFSARPSSAGVRSSHQAREQAHSAMHRRSPLAAAHTSQLSSRPVRPWV